MKPHKMTISNDNISIENINNFSQYKIGEGLIEFVEYDFDYIEGLINNYIDEFYLKEGNFLFYKIKNNEKLYQQYNKRLEYKESEFKNILSTIHNVTYLKGFEPIDLAKIIYGKFINIPLLKSYNSANHSFSHIVYELNYFEDAYSYLLWFGEYSNYYKSLDLDIDAYYDYYLKQHGKNVKFHEIEFKTVLDNFKKYQSKYKDCIDKVLNIDNHPFNKLDPKQRLYLCKHFKILDFETEKPLSVNINYDIYLNKDEMTSYENNPSDKMDNINKFIEDINNQSVSLVQSFCINNLDQILHVEFIQMVKNDTIVRKCKNCSKYFIPYNRPDTLYCDRLITEDGKTCRDVGAMNVYREKVKEDPIMEEYNRAYKRYNARVRYKKITQEQFYQWSEEARKMRDKAQANQITLGEFKEWLNKK